MDKPEGCFGKLPEVDKIKELLYLITADFDRESGVHEISDGEAHSCHQYIKQDGENGQFGFMCCKWISDEDGGGEIDCYEQKASFWVNMLFWLLVIVWVLTLMFGPKMILSFIHSYSVDQSVYEVNLKEPVTVDRDEIFVDKTDPLSKSRYLHHFQLFFVQN